MKLVRQVRVVLREFVRTSLGATHPPRGRSAAGSGARAGQLLAVAVALSALGGCGYQAAYGGSNGARYEVAAGRYSTASFEAVQSTVAGVRSELGAAAALGEGYPRVVVEVLRIDEQSTGVRAAGNETPLARGAEIVVVGRATVITAADAKPSLDTGDMSRAAGFAAGVSPTADAAARSRAIRDASRALGAALGRAILGLPEPSEG